MPINPYEESIITEDALIAISKKTLTNLKPTIDETNTFDIYPLNQVEDYLHRLIVAIRIAIHDNPSIIPTIGQLGLNVSDCIQTREISQILKQSQNLDEAVDMIENRIEAVQIFTNAANGVNYTSAIAYHYNLYLSRLKHMNPENWLILQTELRQQQANTEYLWDLAWTAIAGMNPSLTSVINNLKDIPELTHEIAINAEDVNPKFNQRLKTTLTPKPGDIDSLHF